MSKSEKALLWALLPVALILSLKPAAFIVWHITDGDPFSLPLQLLYLIVGYVVLVPVVGALRIIVKLISPNPLTSS